MLVDLSGWRHGVDAQIRNFSTEPNSTSCSTTPSTGVFQRVVASSSRGAAPWPGSASAEASEIVEAPLGKTAEHTHLPEMVLIPDAAAGVSAACR